MRPIFGAALAAFVLACGRLAPPVPERVVLVSIDTLRADHVGCYGAAEATTPTLDALAARGARFETAISPAPLTLPSHATLLTALDPPEHGVRNNGSYRLREEVPTLAERMHEAGFASAAFVSAFVLDRRFGLARGFDHYDDLLGVQDEEVGVAARSAGQTVDSALAWLEGAPERFFLFVHLYDPHFPYEPPEPHRSRTSAAPMTGRSPTPTPSSGDCSPPWRRASRTAAAWSRLRRIMERASGSMASPRTHSRCTTLRSACPC